MGSYGRSMASRVFAVIILLFQGMNLFPSGRNIFIDFTLLGLVLGAGSLLMHHFTTLLNTILVNFGLSGELYDPVFVFELVGIVLEGAGLGYGLVRKVVLQMMEV